MCEVTPKEVIEKFVTEYRAEIAAEEAARKAAEEKTRPKPTASGSARPPHRLSIGPGDNRINRCRSWLAKHRPSIEGEYGSNAVYQAARVIWNDFGIDEPEGYPLLQEYNRRSDPPWPEDGGQGLRRKWGEAVAKGPCSKGRGWKLNEDRPDWNLSAAIGTRAATGTGDRHCEPAPGIVIGNVTLCPDAPRKTPSGKIVVPVTVVRDDRPVDQITVTSSADGRASAAKLLSKHVGDAASDAVGRILASALERLANDAPMALGSPDLAGLLRERVPHALQLSHRTDRGLWSEKFGREMSRSEFIGFTPSWLVEAAMALTESTDRVALIKSLGPELGVLWCDLHQQLPRAAGADLGKDTAAGRKFREALVRLWTATRTFEVSRGDGAEVASRASLVSRVQTHAAKAQGVPTGRGRWHEVQRAFDAWWRPAVVKGECVTLLAMRWTLGSQIGFELPGVTDQASLTDLGTKFGLFFTPAGVTDRLPGGTRLAVLSPELTNELLAQPAEDDPGDASDTAGASLDDFSPPDEPSPVSPEGEKKSPACARVTD